MTSDVQVGLRAADLGKWYRLERRRPTSTVPEAIRGTLRGLRPRRPEPIGFWALQDVSFELRAGEALGLVGRNGAGKSTLLKILSRITAPTRGSVEVVGRIATLLEVGTGFHPELSGRENVFLNGSILGMGRREIEGKLEGIVDFSGVGRFIDEPVKHYSSGMGVRLAFAVAAHLDSDVLLVDEVLAVGDAEFQRKCLGKMQDVAGEGRAVVFVSHNLNAVQRLCDRALLVDSGRLVLDGPPAVVVAEYLSRTGGQQLGATIVLNDRPDRFGTGEARMLEATLSSLDGEGITAVQFGQPFRVTIVVAASEPIPETAFEIGISNAEGQRVLTAQSIDRERPPEALPAGTHAIEAEVHATLLPGEYVLDLGVHRRSGRTLDYLERVMAFTALNVAETGSDSYPWPGVRGYVRPHSSWSEVRPHVHAGHATSDR
jgi:lipopolysaccharide transport system ATP-binding protein